MEIKAPNILYSPKKDVWVLQEEYFDPTARVIIPNGFRCDLASIPRLLWAIIAPYELSEAAPLVHDYLYRHAGKLVPIMFDHDYVSRESAVSKDTADTLFYEIMRREKVKHWKAKAAYCAVKYFAGFAWKKHLRENIK